MVIYWYFVALISFIYNSIIVLKSLLFGADVPGYSSLVTFILFFSSLQMIGIVILGSYIGRIFIETRCRPLLYFYQVHKVKDK